jgi:hypothetical protein
MADGRLKDPRNGRVFHQSGCPGQRFIHSVRLNLDQDAAGECAPRQNADFLALFQAGFLSWVGVGDEVRLMALEIQPL